MNLIGIVLLSLLGGLFLALLIGGLGILLWVSLKLRKDLPTIQSAIQSLIADHGRESKSQIESAKASFSAIRTEMKAVLDGHNKAMRELLTEHRKQMKEGIDKINAEALIGASARAVQACQRLENAAAIIQKIFLDNQEEPRGTEYGPEEMAPEKTTFGGPPSSYSQSVTAAMDEEVERGNIAQDQSELFTQES